MSKYDIRPRWYVKIGLQMSKFDIRSQFECQHKISNVKISHSTRVRMSKLDFETQILIFGPNSNVILGILFSESYFINQTQTSFP